MPKDIFKILAEADQGGQGAGKGVFCKVKVDMGYRTFMQGVTPETALRIYNPEDEADEKAALEVVTSVVIAAGGDPNSPKQRPVKVVVQHCYANSVIGSTWKQDLDKLILTWTPIWRGVDEVVDGKKKRIIGPAQQSYTDLAAAGKFTGFGRDYFGHITVHQDRSRPADENGQYQTVWYLTEIYANEAELKAAADAAGAGQPVAGSDEKVPDGWPLDTWLQTKPEVIKAINGDWSVPSLAKVAKDYDFTLEFVKSLKPA